MVLKGYDLSNNNGNVNISKLSADFFLFKATEGTYFVDKYCNGFVSQAKKLNKLWGIYHFAGTGSTPKQQANFFVTNIKNYVKQAVLVLDFEAQAIDVWGSAGALEFLDEVYRLTGVRPLIYMSESVVNSHDFSKVAKNYGLWVSKYSNNTPRVRYWSSFAMWQFTSIPYDTNYFYGDKAAWGKYAGTVKVTANKVTKTVTKPANNTYKDELGDTWIKKSGSFKLSQNINLRYGAKTNSTLIATISAGQTIKYDQYSDHNGYRWIRQPRGNGNYGYMATGSTNNFWGYFS